MENATQQQRVSQATADRLEIEIDMLSAALRHSVADIHQSLVAAINEYNAL